MKKLIICLSLFCAAAFADSLQTFTTGILGPASTNAVPALSTNVCTGASALEFGTHLTLPFWIYFNASNGVNGTITFTFAGAPDNTNATSFVTARTNQFVVTAVTSGLSNVVAISASNTARAQFVKLTGVENTNTYSISNITVKLKTP